MLNMKFIRVCAVASALGLAGVSTALADVVVYDTYSDADFRPQGNTYVDAQFANELYYAGTQFAPSQPGVLSTVQILFLSQYYNNLDHDYSGGFSYTPLVRLDLYASVADAEGNINLLGTTTATATFDNDGKITNHTSHINYQDTQWLTFDFTDQGIALPSSVVMVYHDETADTASGDLVGPSSFSVWGRNDRPQDLFVATWPNNVLTDSNFPGGEGYAMVAIVKVVPEPGSLALAGLASLALMHRRRARS